MIRVLTTISILLIGSFDTVKAQFLNMQLTVESELTASVQQSLNFGTLISNSGLQEVPLGDVNMGVFEIRALHTQSLFLNIDYPDALISTDPEISDRIPIDLRFSYNNSGSNLPSDSVPLNNGEGYVSVTDESLQNTEDVWQEMYVYVFGTINVPEVSTGTYEGYVTLTIDYD